MAFEFDPDHMFKMCALYLSKGLILVRVHGIYPNGRCTCGNPLHIVDTNTFAMTPNSKKVGKHPVGDDWGNRGATTEDEIERWLEDGIPFNVGCLLGPRGGSIDSEDDDPAARAFRESIGMDLLETPTWLSGKSEHQMTQWDDRLAGLKGVLKVGGLEVRTGAGDRAIQSILPPSWHWSGVQYRWKPGFSIDEVDIAPTPRELLLPIVNGIEGVSRPASDEPPARNILFGKVNDGEGRHRKMLRWAWFKIVSTRNPEGAAQRENILQELLNLNQLNLVPSKTRDEIVSIHASCYEHYRRRRDSGWSPTDADCEEPAVEEAVKAIDSNEDIPLPPVSGFAEQGLEQYKIGNVVAYRPGADWKIEMVHSDPVEIVLCVKQWKNTPCKGRVSLSMDDFRSPMKVASAVFTATRRVMLDANPSAWKRVWNGQEPSKKNDWNTVPGVCELLVTKKNREDDIQVGVSSLRYATLAGYVLQVFKKATQPRDEEKPEPNESGRPCWVKPDELWFQWAKIWEDITRTHDVVPGERNKIRGKLLRMMDADDFVHERHRFASGRLEYVVFGREWVQAVERLAAGDDSSSDGGEDLDSKGGETARKFDEAEDKIDRPTVILT